MESDAIIKMALGSEIFCLTHRALYVSWGNASLPCKLHGTTIDVDSASPAELERLIRAINQDTNESEANLRREIGVAPRGILSWYDLLPPLFR